MVFQAAQLIVSALKAHLLVIHGIKPPGKRQPSLSYILIQRPQVVGVQDIESREQFRIGRGIEAHLPEGLNVRQVYAFSQPDGPRPYLLHSPAGFLPKGHRHGAGYIATEAIHILCPVAQRINLILPQRAVFIVQVHHIGPVAHLIAAAAIRLIVEVVRMLRHQCGIGRGVVIHHINDALHTPLMDLLHQVQKILQCAVFRVHGAVVPVGIGAAQASFFVQLPNRVDGHKPYNIHPQCRYPVQVRLYRLKGPLRCVAAYIYFIDHAAPQRIVGIYGHGVSSFIWAFFLGRPAHRGTIFRVDYTRFPRAFQDAFAGITA